MSTAKPDPINEHYLSPTVLFCMGVQLITVVFYGYHLVAGATDAFHLSGGYEFGDLSIIAYRGARFFSEESFVRITQMILYLVILSFALNTVSLLLRKRGIYLFALVQSIAVLVFVSF
jgi:hypothetical protein